MSELYANDGEIVRLKALLTRALNALVQESAGITEDRSALIQELENAVID